jgi:hypothetical protein
LGAKDSRHAEQNQFRCPAWIHVSEGRKCHWHCRFLQRHPLQSEAKLLVTGHRPRHDIAAGLCAIPDVAVANIPTECWFIQKFKDEISVIGALVPQEEPFGVENIHLPISVPYRVQLTPGGGAKLRPTIS